MYKHIVRIKAMHYVEIRRFQITFARIVESCPSRMDRSVISDRIARAFQQAARDDGVAPTKLRRPNKWRAPPLYFSTAKYPATVDFIPAEFYDGLQRCTRLADLQKALLYDTT